MKETIEKIKVWVLANKTIAGIIGAVIIFFLAKKFGGRVTRRRRRRTIPRSVGIRRNTRRRARSSNRIIKSGRNRGKKAWQIKGSEAARRHMASIRRRRSKKLF